MDEAKDTAQKPKGWFVTTHWSVVLEARNHDSPQAHEAMESLCRGYWYPLYAHVRRRGYSHEDAQDLTQEFFARFLQKEWLTAADPEKGRFRTFLLVALNRFLANQWRRAGAQKRGGHFKRLSVDVDHAQVRFDQQQGFEDAPDAVYERQWALTLLDRAKADLAAEYARLNQSEVHAALSRYLAGDRPGQSYVQAGRFLGISESAVKKAVQRLRARYADCIRTQIAQTVCSLLEIEDEIRHLMSVFRK